MGLFMIYSVRGKLIHRDVAIAVVECAGVGYLCRTTLNTLSRIDGVGSEVTLYTYLHVREDAMELFGFYDMQELNCFKLLISVSGVGPKAALLILSDYNAEKFALIVASGDSKALTKTKGIGIKLAQRIVLELKDKIAKESISVGETFTSVSNAYNGADSAISEAVSALVVLGYSQMEAVSTLAKLDQTLQTSELIKQALKLMGTNL